MRRTAAWASLFLVPLLAGGCTDTTELSLLRVSGTVVLPQGAAGDINLIAFQVHSLTGELSHPLQRIEQWQSPTTAFAHDIQYPITQGEGIAVFAWLDVDGDGVHCTPEFRDEPAGLAVADTIDGNINFTVELTTNCVGADWFYPAAPK